jgi:putative endonuclease
MRVKDAVGRFGENLAVRFLIEVRRCVLLDTNWRCPIGELDIVALDGDVLVFVEVKTRSTTAFGDPAEAINPEKAARIRALAMRWIAERRATHPADRWRELRFDVIAVVRLADDGPAVRHIEAAF